MLVYLVVVVAIIAIIGTVWLSSKHGSELFYNEPGLGGRNKQKTKLIDGTYYPICKNPVNKPDDGWGRRWGWEDGKSCVEMVEEKSKSQPSKPRVQIAKVDGKDYRVCQKPVSKPYDEWGRRWGWEDGQSCVQFAEKQTQPKPQKQPQPKPQKQPQPKPQKQPQPQKKPQPKPQKLPQARQLNWYEQCGGEGGVCSTKGVCKDAAWPGTSCPKNAVCVRTNNWHWQCDAKPKPQKQPQSKPQKQPQPKPQKQPQPKPQKQPQPKPQKQPQPKPQKLPQARQLNWYEQCGGEGGVCSTKGVCKDAAWPGTSCPKNAVCVRANNWHWQCDAKPKPQPQPQKQPQPKPQKQPQSRQLNWGEQCGGEGGACSSKGVCKDAPWPGTYCPQNATCSRANNWHWQCDARSQPQSQPQPQAPQSQPQPQAPQSQPQPQAPQSQQSGGSCYGARSTSDCNTCDDVINAYKAQNWKYDIKNFAQCRDKILDEGERHHDFGIKANTNLERPRDNINNGTCLDVLKDLLKQGKNINENLNNYEQCKKLSCGEAVDTYDRLLTEHNVPDDSRYRQVYPDYFHQCRGFSSCYGAKDVDNCRSCRDVIDAHLSKGSHVGNPLVFVQCRPWIPDESASPWPGYNWQGKPKRGWEHKL